MQTVKLKISEFLLNNYFLFLSINAVLLIIDKRFALFESLFFPIIAYVLLFKSLPKQKFNLFDLFIILMFIWFSITWIINDYDNKLILILRCFLSQIAFMLFYFIGKTQNFNDYVFLKKSIIPLVIISVLGLWFFYSPPSWYLNQIYANEYYNEYNYLELARLRSIFPSPYHISYMCSIVFIYLIYKFYENKKWNIFYIGILFITLILTMMRAPIVMTLFAIAIFIIHNLIFQSIHKISKIFMVSISIVIFIFLIMQNFNIMNNDYLIMKYETVIKNSDELIKQRTELDFEYNLVGDGVGRHAIYAFKYKQQDIRDSEYIKILVEQGYIGLFIFGFFSFFALIKCVSNFKYLSFELSILLFYLITMIGANSLSTADKHCFIFWLIVGKISAFKKINN